MRHGCLLLLFPSTPHQPIPEPVKRDETPQVPQETPTVSNEGRGVGGSVLYIALVILRVCHSLPAFHCVYSPIAQGSIVLRMDSAKYYNCVQVCGALSGGHSIPIPKPRILI